MVGIANVGSPELLDTHRRDAWRMRASPEMEVAVDASVCAEMRLAFRYFRPPLKARVELAEGGRPKRVYAQQIYGTVVECAGPWKGSGEWFRESAAWSREEWDLGLNDGGLYRAFSVEAAARDWYLEGSYD
jgi:protein ImuB